MFVSLSQVYAGKTIRILISKPADKIELTGEFSLYSDSKMIQQLKDITIPVSFSENMITLFKSASYPSVFLKKTGEGYFKIGDYKYDGELKIISRDKKMYLVNYLDVEEYIQGVLPNEISPKWHIEVIKAQTVAARTFAYFYIEKNKGEIYDLTDNTYAQVYKGTINEDPVFNEAIVKTAGEVLVFKNELIQSFFHSVCGGHTENAGKVWGKNLPYLKGIPCNYCSTAKYYRWEETFSEEEILQKLKAHGFDLENIRSFSPAIRSGSGRWVKVKISGSKKSVLIPGNKFRLIMGIEKIRSTKFTVRRNKNGKGFVFSGKGWGHGVGLCQWGAKKMAEKGYKYYRILRYYYRGTELLKMNSSNKRSVNSERSAVKKHKF